MLCICVVSAFARGGFFLFHKIPNVCFPSLAALSQSSLQHVTITRSSGASLQSEATLKIFAIKESLCSSVEPELLKDVCHSALAFGKIVQNSVCLE